LELRVGFREAGLDVYVPSLSARLVSYKGLLTSPHLCDFYPDLKNPGFSSGIAIFHRRYSTNTFPNWKLAQPFRLTCHNGEINTVRTNRNAVQAFSRGLTPPPPGGDLLTEKMSDSASLDEWLEYLQLEQNWSLLRALRLDRVPDVVPVALAQAALGDGGRLLRALPGLGYRGTVVEAMGGGHLPRSWASP